MDIEYGIRNVIIVIINGKLLRLCIVITLENMIKEIEKMTFNEVIVTILLIFVVTICLYTLVDRVCNCAEKCAFIKGSADICKKTGDESEEN